MDGLFWISGCISVAARVNISQKPACFNHGIRTKKIRAIVMTALIPVF
ncbi:MAG: hypothetical protein ACYDHC_11560 [Desulfuromonadaceae bacterium]